MCLHNLTSREACPVPEVLASRCSCFNSGNIDHISWKKCSISWNPTEERFVPHRSSSFMLTAGSSPEARVRRSAARNWLLLCECADCNITKPQECIEKPVAPSTKEIRLNCVFFFFFFLVSKKSSRHQTALLFVPKVVSLFFPSSLFFFRFTFPRHSVIPTARRKFRACGSPF